MDHRVPNLVKLALTVDTRLGTETLSMGTTLLFPEAICTAEIYGRRLFYLVALIDQQIQLLVCSMDGAGEGELERILSLDLRRLGNKNPVATLYRTKKGIPGNEETGRNLPGSGLRVPAVGREGDVALLEKRKPSIHNPLCEVVIVQEMEAHAWPDGEHLPGSWQWGSAGWFYSDSEDAWAKFRELTGGRGRPGGEVADPVTRLNRLREALE